MTQSESESRSVVSQPLRTRILQAKIPECVPIPFSRGSSQPRTWTQATHIAGRFLPAEPPGKPHKVNAEDSQGAATSREDTASLPPLALPDFQPCACACLLRNTKEETHSSHPARNAEFSWCWKVASCWVKSLRWPWTHTKPKEPPLSNPQNGRHIPKAHFKIHKTGGLSSVWKKWWPFF